MLSGWLPLAYENFRELLNLSGGYGRGRKPPAEKWVFLSHRLIYRVGGQNKKQSIFQNYWTTHKTSALSNK
jgi:hypothetical protein